MRIFGGHVLSLCRHVFYNSTFGSLSNRVFSCDQYRQLRCSRLNMSMQKIDYHAPLPPVYSLEAGTQFCALGEKEKQYAHACTEAAWIGGLIDLIQVSPEAAGFFLVIQRIFRKQKANELYDKAIKSGFSESEVEKIFAFIAMFYANLGNYLSYGDRKFIPNVPLELLSKFFKLSEAYADSNSRVRELWEAVQAPIYSLHPRRLQLNFKPDGITNYYSSNCTKTDAEFVQDILRALSMEAYNTRVFKEVSESGQQKFVIRIASSEKHSKAVDSSTINASLLSNTIGNSTVMLQYGDYSDLMALLVKSLNCAKATSLNANEVAMWDGYTKCFETGCIEHHKTGSRFWVKDKCPPVESYIGFIETYRDPFGVRGEFEGFVAIVNQEQSRKFQALVDHSDVLLKSLPWPAAYEKDKFLRPDFTSLDIIAYACSGVPLGINIPNYDDVRQDDGFKNVSLGNVISARFKDPKVQYLSEDDKVIYNSNIIKAEEVSVGLHELLGHGSGKLFKADAKGVLNFDPQVTQDLLSEKPILSWYKTGETYDSKFSGISSAMEECRAECVALYLGNIPKVLDIFGLDVPEDGVVSDCTYIVWLAMMRAGLVGLEWFQPASNTGDSGNWGQAHCCARYVIFKTLLELEEPVVRVKQITGEDGQPDLQLLLDRGKLLTVARPAIGKLLQRLQYYRSTGQAEEGTAFFNKYSSVPQEHLDWRNILLARKKPHPLFVQPVIRRDGEEVKFVSYPSTYMGIIESCVDRYTHMQFGLEAEQALENIWRQDQPHFCTIPL